MTAAWGKKSLVGRSERRPVRFDSEARRSYEFSWTLVEHDFPQHSHRDHEQHGFPWLSRTGLEVVVFERSTVQLR